MRNGRMMNHSGRWHCTPGTRRFKSNESHAYKHPRDASRIRIGLIDIDSKWWLPLVQLVCAFFIQLPVCTANRTPFALRKYWNKQTVRTTAQSQLAYREEELATSFGMIVWGALFQFMRIIWQTVQFGSPFAVAGSFSSELCEIWPDGSFGRSLTQSGLSVTTDEMHNRPNELVIELVIEPQWLKVWKFHRESIRALNSERCECGEFGELRHMHLLLFTQAGHCWATKWIRFLFQWPTRLRISPTFCWYNLPFVLLPKWPNHLVLAVWA